MSSIKLLDFIFFNMGNGGKTFQILKRLFVLLVVVTNVEAQQPQIIAKLNLDTLNIHYSEEDREQLYAVLDSNEIILAVDKTLMFIKDNKLRRKVISPVHIFAFDVSKHGNGVIVSDGAFYKIKKFQIQANPIITKLEKPKEGNVIWRVDMINDSIIRVFMSDSAALFYINIDSLESNNFVIKTDEASAFIGDRAVSAYVGQYKGKYCFLMKDMKDKSECLIIRGDLIRDSTHDEKIIKFGYLGRSDTETVHIRYDEETHLFYEMLYKDHQIVLYRFNMKDYF
jgi:hypothetical protein